MQDDQQPSETVNVSGGEVESNKFTGNSGSIFKDNSGSVTINHNYLARPEWIPPYNISAIGDESSKTLPVQENKLSSSEIIPIKDKLDNLLSEKRELEIKLEYIELEISRIESKLKSEANPSLAALLHWLSDRKSLAEKYGKIVLRGFQSLRQEAEKKGDLDDFSFEFESYLELIFLSLREDDKIFLQESRIPPTFADPDLYKNASSDIYKEMFRILKENIPKDNIESSLKSKLEEHFNELLERLQVYF